MLSLNMRCKSAILAVMMVASSSSFGAFSLPTPQRAATVVTFVGVLATWIRLNSKGSLWDYTTDNWRADFEAFLHSYNIFDAESRATLLRLYDKWIVGRQFSVIDITYRDKDENGTVVTRKDKKIKAKPFGLMGLFDAYVLCQIKKINEHVKEIQSINQLVKDPVTLLTKDPK